MPPERYKQMNGERRSRDTDTTKALTTKSAVSEDGVLVNRALFCLSGEVELFFYKYL